MPAGWAAAPGPVHIAENECPGPTEAGFVVLSPGRCRPAAKRDQTHHSPGSPRPPAQRRPSPAPCGDSFCPMHRCRRRNPAYHESAVHGRAGPAGEETKNRGFRTQSRPDRILPTAGRTDPRAAFPGHGLRRLPGACVAAGIAFNASPPASSQNRCDRSSGGSCRRRCRCFRP